MRSAYPIIDWLVGRGDHQQSVRTKHAFSLDEEPGLISEMLDCLERDDDVDRGSSLSGVRLRSPV